MSSLPPPDEIRRRGEALRAAEREDAATRERERREKLEASLKLVSEFLERVQELGIRPSTAHQHRGALLRAEGYPVLSRHERGLFVAGPGCSYRTQEFREFAGIRKLLSSHRGKLIETEHHVNGISFFCFSDGYQSYLNRVDPASIKAFRPDGLSLDALSTALEQSLLALIQ